jgi:hypothetical protein
MRIAVVERKASPRGQRTGRGPEGAPGRGAPAGAGRERRRGFDPDAPRRHVDLDAIALEGLQMQMMHGNGMGFKLERHVHHDLLDAHAELARSRQRTVAHAKIR